MPSFTCPRCGSTLPAERAAGGCPVCAALLDEAGAGDSADPGIRAIALKVQRLTRTPETIAWTAVRAGQGLLVVGVLLAAVGFPPLLLGGPPDWVALVRGPARAGRDLLPALGPVILLLTGGVLVAAGLWLTGEAPRGTEARAWGRALRIVLVLHVLLMGAALFVSAARTVRPAARDRTPPPRAGPAGPAVGQKAAWEAVLRTPWWWMGLAFAVAEAGCFAAFVGSVGSHFSGEPAGLTKFALVALSVVLVAACFLTSVPVLARRTASLRLLALMLGTSAALAGWLLLLARQSRATIAKGVLGR